MAITNPADVIKHIIHKEVQHDSDEIAVDMASYNENIGTPENPGINSDITLAFTVHDKQINSKKLIEGIASNSRLIPYIKDNELILKGIMASPSPEDDINHTIDQSDIISYTNKRTAPEKVYSKVIVNYHYDYALKEFAKNTVGGNDSPDTATEYFEHWEDPHNSEQVYDITNLGLEKEQELIFDAHYIRDPSSAETLQEFLLLWHCNQHNILKLRLPLKYIQLKIGDYIGFDKLINDVKLFGEDYSIENFPGYLVHRNAQQILPVWMIPSTSKILTHIDVEMIQMHNCSSNIVSMSPEVDTVTLELFHSNPELQDTNVINNNIILSSVPPVMDATYFHVKLTTNVDTDSPLGYDFDFDGGIISNTFDVYEYITANLTLDLDSCIPPYIEYEGSGFPVEGISENNITFDLGVHPDEIQGFYGENLRGEWLAEWLRDDTIENGEYLEFPSGLFHTSATDGNFISSSYDFPAFRIYKNEIPGEIVTVSIDYDEGWNLVSLPVEVDNSVYSNIFPEAVPGSLYTFDGTYMYAGDVDMEIGKGYWLRFDNSGTVEITGFVEAQYEIALGSDWYLISGISEEVTIANISDPDGIIVPGTLYGFGDAYVQTDTLVPGKGYWIRTNNSGTITINTVSNA